MNGETKFFFEEDASSPGSLDSSEQADIFGEVVAESGVKSGMTSMAPLGVEVLSDVKEIRNTLLLVEYGTVGDDYAIHVTPLHPSRNLQNDQKLNRAIRLVVEEMNKYIPFDVRVDIHLPQKDWEIKATSFIARGAKVAWNVDINDLNTKLIPSIVDGVTNICK